MLRLPECNEAAKPEWCNDEGLNALSARVVRAAPNFEPAVKMRANILSGIYDGAWEVGPRSAAELKEAAVHYDRSAALSDAPVGKAYFARMAVISRSQAEAV